MFRFTYVAGMAIATVVVVPAVVDGKGPPDSIEQALQRTIAALEHLSGIEQRLRERDPNAIAQAVAATEAPLPALTGEPQWRDARLEELRQDVVRLQGELDHDSSTALVPAPLNTPASNAPTTGLDDATREALASAVHATSKDGSPVSAKHDASKPSDKQAFEPEGYAADPLRLGHAYFRQRDFARALAMFSLREDDLEATYWRGRCLEQLGRNDEAIHVFEGLVAGGGQSWTAERAKEDLDFLHWRTSFDKRVVAQKTDKQ